MDTPTHSYTIREYAEIVGVSYTTVRKWIAQGRVPVGRHGGMYKVLTDQRPPPLAGGELNAESRQRWNYGRRYTPGKSAPSSTGTHDV